MEGARVLLQVVCVLAAAGLATAQIVMDVEYPSVGNQNVVELTCRMSDDDTPLLGAQFLKDGIPLTQGPASDQVTSLTIAGDGVVTITFNQAQEGFFGCRYEDQPSPEIALAGKDSVDISVHTVY